PFHLIGGVIRSPALRGRPTRSAFKSLPAGAPRNPRPKLPPASLPSAHHPRCGKTSGLCVGLRFLSAPPDTHRNQLMRYNPRDGGLSPPPRKGRPAKFPTTPTPGHHSPGRDFSCPVELSGKRSVNRALLPKGAEEGFHFAQHVSLV